MDARRGGLSGIGTGFRALLGEAWQGMRSAGHGDILARAFAWINTWNQSSFRPCPWCDEVFMGTQLIEFISKTARPCAGGPALLFA